jgi:hypothetical protein
VGLSSSYNGDLTLKARHVQIPHFYVSVSLHPHHLRQYLRETNNPLFHSELQQNQQKCRMVTNITVHFVYC